MKLLALTLILAGAAAWSAPAFAQTRASRAVGRPAAAAPAKAAAPQPEPVDVAEVFAVATAAERWALEDAMPNGVVAFAGERLSFADRLVNATNSVTGERQLLFPVSWFERYQETGPDLKFVVVRYRNGRACQIVAEYLPQRLSIPREQFVRHPDGKSYYSDLSVARQDGRVYMKQAISQGADDGKGGLWVDTVVIYCTEQTARTPQN